MKLALEALEHLQPTALTSFYTIGDRDKAITALRKALAEQPAQQEPVAWMSDVGSVASAHEKKMGYVLESAFTTPLYTSPPASKPLTEEVKNEFWIEAIKHGRNGQLMNWQKAADFYADAIEAAHSIKEKIND